MKSLFSIACIFCFSLVVFSQEITTEKKQDSITEISRESIAIKPIKVSFYSAILPGLGQAYNKKYWKIPIVYGALGTSTYYYIYNNNRYQEYRTAFKLHKLGQGESSQYPTLSLDVLQQAQEYHKKDRDLSMMVTIGLYFLQIIEASVDAHLQYHNIDNKLGFSPGLVQEPISGNTGLAISLTYRF